MKCDNCQHREICKNHDNMKKFESEIREKERLLEYKTFHADIRCDHYVSENNIVFTRKAQI